MVPVFGLLVKRSTSWPVCQNNPLLATKLLLHTGPSTSLLTSMILWLRLSPCFLLVATCSLSAPLSRDGVGKMSMYLLDSGLIPIQPADRPHPKPHRSPCVEQLPQQRAKSVGYSGDVDQSVDAGERDKVFASLATDSVVFTELFLGALF